MKTKQAQVRQLFERKEGFREEQEALRKAKAVTFPEVET
jgi:phage tail protein X